MDYNLIAPQAILILTSTEHSLLYSSHAVIASLDTATMKHDETKQTAMLNALVAQLLFEHEDKHTLAVFAPGQTTLACNDRMSQEEQGIHSLRCNASAAACFTWTLASLHAICSSIALTCGASWTCAPRDTTAFARVRGSGSATALCSTLWIALLPWGSNKPLLFYNCLLFFWRGRGLRRCLRWRWRLSRLAIRSNPDLLQLCSRGL